MHSLLRLLIPALLAVTALPVQAADPARSERLRVGTTNIFCVVAPCPWRGIAKADSARLGPVDLIWSAQHLPRLDALPEDVVRISESWNANNCLEVEGALNGSTLIVDRIIGECA
ncbi:hypothetical protein [Devosia sp. SD17-2]|uniref:hypothetical protein n=1 Tax=Devosia sp. SD17-2 TaxID=2976459 RepID=UPI0023D84B76|nr:hypothetical protein [Devosia sp. SD17-2]WEJ34107.1 hypothetical protein NYQ88_04700 [Devosia sp. SD17-2]